MKTFISTCLFLILTLISSLAFGFNVPTRDGFVNDHAGKLSSQDKTRLEAKARSIYDKTHNQVVILILPSLEGDSVEDVAYNTFNTWKIGSAGLDNGVLFVVSVGDRKTRIETGKGIGAEITDLQSKDILVNLREPLRNNDYATACDMALNKISSLLESRREAKPARSSCSMTGGQTMQFVLVSIFTILSLLFIIRYSMRKHAEHKKLVEELTVKQEEKNEILIREMMASSLPPCPSFFSEPSNQNLFRFNPIETMEDEDKTPVYSISPMAESYPDSERPTIPNIVARTVSNIPVVNFDDEPTQPNLDIDRLSKMSIHPKSGLKI